MKLKRLQLHGFKSFAHKSELVFDAPIISIVGPNGSGKSNVVESIRFVLGEQSMKSLRGSAGSDLIFRGNNKTMNRASVEITFDNKDRVFTLSSIDNAKISVDFDEVTIRREVFSDGKNTYSINGHEVRLKDVMELIASVNIGASGHHIISQGEADRLLNANARERRAMLEDALGLKVYQYRIRESERKLERTEENLKESNSLRREIAPHIKFLKRQVDKIEKAKGLRVDLFHKYQQYLVDQGALLRAQKSEILHNREGVSKESIELKHTLQEYEMRLASEGKTDEENMLAAIEKKKRDVLTTKAQIVRQIGRIEGMIEAAESNLKRSKETKPKTGAGEFVSLDKVEFKSFFKDLRNGLNTARNYESIMDVKSSVARALKSIDAFIFKNNDPEEKDTRPAETKLFESQLKEFQTEYKDLSETLVSIVQEEKTLMSEQSEIEKKIEEVRAGSRQREQDMFALTKRFNELGSQLNAFGMKQEVVDRALVRFQEEQDEALTLLGVQILKLDTVRPGFDVSQLATLDIGAIEKDIEERRRTIERVKIKIEEIGGGSGADVMQEYDETMERDQFLEREIADMDTSMKSLQEVIDGLRVQLHEEFTKGVVKINTEFKKFFISMFGGGDAKLSLVEITKRKKKKSEGEDDELSEPEEESTGPIEEGVDINVKLPRKKVQDLTMLSGGERSLTSIALLFALSQVNPPPFLVLDETDAALDEANSKKYGDMIESLSNLSQLMVVTHNRETMSRANILYGVTLGSDDSSQLLSVKLDDAEKYAK